MTEKKRFDVANILLFLSIAILVIFVAFPVLLILGNALFGAGSFNPADLMRILSNAETYRALRNSLIISCGTTFFGTLIGTFFAWLVTRTDLPMKGIFKTLFLVPFMFPSFIGAMAWKMLLNPRSGYINRFFMDVLGFDSPIFNIYSYLGIILVETMYLFPFVFIQVSGALERMDPTLEESARISGARLFTVTRKITLPLVWPGIVSGALLIMLYSMAHFGTVAVLGTRNGIYNIPTLIYEKINASAGSFASIRTGTVLASILVVAAAFILWLQGRVTKSGRYQIVSGKSFRPSEMKLRGFRYPLFILCLIYILFTVALPTIIIFMVGGLKTYGLPFTAENLSLNNYRYVLFHWKLTKDAIRNSIVLGFSAALITMFAGAMISFVLVKMRSRGRGLLQFLGVLPFSVPGSVIALGVILAWSGRFGINLYNTVWIILVAYIARYMAFSLKANSAALEQIHDSLIEAARASGASMGRALRDVVFPLARPGMVSAFFLIFLPSLRELTVSVMLYSPATRTLGVAIYSLSEDGDTVRASALAGIALIIIIIGEILVRTALRQSLSKRR